MNPRVLILRTAGTNCDVETARAFDLAGAHSSLMHLNELLNDPGRMSDFQILAIPGGFSYGDDISAGRILANQLMHHLHDVLHGFVAAGKPIIGICNGFQVLVKTDLLPGPIAERAGQSCTLTSNACGHFVDRWIHLTERSKKCVWTTGLNTFELPVAHGEGRFIAANAEVRQALWDRDQVALTYSMPDGTPAGGSFPENPNGSADDIAGICDASGLVFGLMPHPERHVSRLQHPAWTSPGGTDEGGGMRIFANAVGHARAGVGAGI